jgi:hypothetical protein
MAPWLCPSATAPLPAAFLLRGRAKLPAMLLGLSLGQAGKVVLAASRRQPSGNGDWLRGRWRCLSPFPHCRK